VGLIAYYGGKAVADTIARYGVYAGIVIVVALVVGWLGLRFVRGRVERRL
jgi:membrane protein DedA with SNARE-associated domain